MNEFFCQCNDCGATWFFQDSEEEYPMICPNCNGMNIGVNNRPIYDMEGLCEICIEDLDEPHKCIICNKIHCSNCNDIELSQNDYDICLECSLSYRLDTIKQVKDYLKRNDIDIE